MDTETEIRAEIDRLKARIAKLQGKAEAGQAEHIYKLYPRKVGRTAALKAINKAIKEAGFDDLLESVKAYADAVAKWPEDDKRFIPHPATWFNRGSYMDDRAEWERKKEKKSVDLRAPSPLAVITNTEDGPYFN